jgi:hypothetical protein
MSFLTGIRPEPPRIMLPRLEPVLEERILVELDEVEREPALEHRPVPALVEIQPVRFEPIRFEPVQIATIELPPPEPACVDPASAEPALFETVPVQEPVAAAVAAAELLPVEGRAIELPRSTASPAVIVRRRSGAWRIVGGLLSAAAYPVASLMLLAAGPVYLVMSDRQDIVRWSNELLDLVSRW